MHYLLVMKLVSVTGVVICVVGLSILHKQVDGYYEGSSNSRGFLDGLWLLALSIQECFSRIHILCIWVECMLCEFRMQKEGNFYDRLLFRDLFWEL